MKLFGDVRYQLAMKWATLLMALGYLGLGAAILLSLGDLQYVPLTTRVPLGLMMVFYGLFRIYRFVVKYYPKKGNDEA